MNEGRDNEGRAGSDLSGLLCFFRGIRNDAKSGRCCGRQPRPAEPNRPASEIERPSPHEAEGARAQKRNRYAYVRPKPPWRNSKPSWNESFDIDTPDEGSVVKGQGHRHRGGTSHHRCRLTRWKAASISRNSQTRAKRPGSMSATRSTSFCAGVENARGEAVISHENGQGESRLGPLEKGPTPTRSASTAPSSAAWKGGFTVDLGGAVAFLPASQVDVRPVRGRGPAHGSQAAVFQILKMDRRRGNIVVSRRAILEESRAEQRAEGHRQAVGRRRRGRRGSRTSTEYGAFVDLGSVDGRCTVNRTGLAPRQRPQGDPVDRREPSRCRSSRSTRTPTAISLGMKQLQDESVGMPSRRAYPARLGAHRPR